MSKKLNLLSCEDCQKLSLKQKMNMYQMLRMEDPYNPQIKISLFIYIIVKILIERIKKTQFIFIYFFNFYN